jgi:hypothetical protein
MVTKNPAKIAPQETRRVNEGGFTTVSAGINSFITAYPFVRFNFPAFKLYAERYERAVGSLPASDYGRSPLKKKLQIQFPTA